MHNRAPPDRDGDPLNGWSCRDAGLCRLGRLGDQTALLNGILDPVGGDGLDLDRDRVHRLFDREEQVPRHVNGGGPGLDLDEQDVVTVDDNFSALIDPVELYQRHNVSYPASPEPFFKPLQAKRLARS